MYYKGTEQECLDYNNQVTQGENYQGTTKRWANPIEIEGSWYILKHEKYNSDLEVVNELPEIKQETE